MRPTQAGCATLIPLLSLSQATVEALARGVDIYDTISQRLVQALLDFACFMLLFSQIIPISLRVALDVAKLIYKVQLTSDRRMPGLQVRSSNIPEDLGGPVPPTCLLW